MGVAQARCVKRHIPQINCPSCTSHCQFEFRSSSSGSLTHWPQLCSSRNDEWNALFCLKSKKLFIMPPTTHALTHRDRCRKDIFQTQQSISIVLWFIAHGCIDVQPIGARINHQQMTPLHFPSHICSTMPVCLKWDLPYRV